MCDASQNIVQNQCDELLDLLGILHNRSVLFVGDSLSQQTYDALVIHALRCGLDVTSTRESFMMPNGTDYCYDRLVNHSTDWKRGVELCDGVLCSAYTLHHALIPKCNVRFALLNVYRASSRSRPDEYYFRTCKMCHIIELALQYTFTVVNFGLHFRKDHDALRSVLLALKNLIYENTNVYYRLTIPQSFPGKDNGYHENIFNTMNGSTSRSNCVRNASRSVLNMIESEVFTELYSSSIMADINSELANGAQIHLPYKSWRSHQTALSGAGTEH
jgi:hypothetical protein